MSISQQDLKARLHGELVTPEDGAYDSVRKIFNGRIDKHPALIVFCADVDDVVIALQFARQEALTIAVRSGGHSIPGHALCDDGIVIDLSRMKAIQVDAAQRTCRAQSGLTLSEFVAATQEYGLTTTVGVGTTTGLAGLTLGGGVGWLMGKYGLTIDNLLAVELVTAEGEVIRASANEHADLFWAVRGGGGNFGIITAFEFQLHEVGQVLAGMVVHPLSQAREVLRFYREYTRNCPDELGVYTILLKTPDGKALINFVVCYAGPLDEGERVLAPLRAFGHPLADLVRPMSIAEANQLIDQDKAMSGWNNYQGGQSLLDLDAETIDVLADQALHCPAPVCLIFLEHQHGAACRVAPTATAYALRQECYILLATVVWPSGAGEEYIAWVQQFVAALRPFSDHGRLYINYLEDEGDERIRVSYGPNYERLTQIKRIYDPTNIFRVNQNITPARQHGDG